MDIDSYLKQGGKITRCPTINKTSDRYEINKDRPTREKPKRKKVKPLSKAICDACSKDKDCLACQHYRQFSRLFDERSQIAFDHLPEFIEQEVAALPQPDIVTRIRQLPLEKSVPLMMKFYLHATNREIAEFIKVTPQAVDKKNKKTITELRILIRS